MLHQRAGVRITKHTEPGTMRAADPVERDGHPACHAAALPPPTTRARGSDLPRA
jgi:hypothetical protein